MSSRNARQRLHDARQNSNPVPVGRRRPVRHGDAVGHVGERQAAAARCLPARASPAAKAGVIASSAGSAMAAPMPRRNVRRGR